MDSAVISKSVESLAGVVTNIGLKAIGALALYLTGRWLINRVLHLVERALERQSVDPTLLRYVGTVLGVLANIALVMAILGYAGVETTSFAALLAGAGLAIGTAWGGLLTNFAAGAFLVILRPYKVGDAVRAGDVTGTVRAIGLFNTTIDTADNVQTHVGNSKILGGTIQNFSANSHRRVDLSAQLHHDVDVEEAITRLCAKLATIPNVLTSPAPVVEISHFSELGPVLAVRPSAHPDHYGQVSFATNRAIAALNAEAGFPVPERRVRLQSSNGESPRESSVRSLIGS